MTEKVNDSADTIIIHGKRYTKERAWAPSKNISYRTSKRHRDNGMPWLEWGGEVYIPDTDGDAYILQFVRSQSAARRAPPPAGSSPQHPRIATAIGRPGALSPGAGTQGCGPEAQ